MKIQRYEIIHHRIPTADNQELYDIGLWPSHESGLRFSAFISFVFFYECLPYLYANVAI